MIAYFTCSVLEFSRMLQESKQLESDKPLLVVRDVHVWYPVRTGVLARVTDNVRAVNGVSFTLSKGEILGLVGESGCGKTTLARALLGLEPLHSGQVLLDGRDITSFASREERRAFTRAMQVVFQDPFASLNPRHTVLDLLTEGMLAHGLATRENRRDHAKRLLRAVGLRDDILDRYPHAFSGGQRQRIAIARALSLNPRVLICDEAVSALDLSVRAQILNLLADLRDEFGLAYLFITHDISVVRHIADRIAVMNGGKIVEIGTADDILDHPQHPYTRELLAAVPKIR